MMSSCTVHGCESEVYARGCCYKHYRRLQRYGTTQLINSRFYVVTNRGRRAVGLAPRYREVLQE